MIPLILTLMELVHYIFTQEIARLNNEFDKGVLQRQLQLLNCKTELLLALDKLKEHSIILKVSGEQSINNIKEGQPLYEITLSADWTYFTIKRVLFENMKLEIKT
jgi:hypothetical protein